MEKLSNFFHELIFCKRTHGSTVDKDCANESRKLCIEFAEWCREGYIVNNVGRWMSKKPMGEHFISYTERKLFDIFIEQKKF